MAKMNQQAKREQDHYEDQFNPDEDLDIFDFETKKDNKNKINDADQLGSVTQIKGSSDEWADTMQQTDSKQGSESKLVSSDDHSSKSQLQINEENDLKKTQKKTKKSKPYDHIKSSIYNR